jgi:anti-anti-sigma factor
MPISTSERYHAAVVEIKGKFFGSRDGAEYQETIQRLLGSGKTQIVLDLSGTELMDSSGIGALIESAQKVRAKGGDIRLAGVEKKMKNLFLMTRLLGEVFQDYETVDEAAQSFSDDA